MRRTLTEALALLLLWPAIRAGDDPKDKPSTPAEQYEALVKEYQQAQQDYSKEMRAAKTAEERQKVFQEKPPKLGGFLELAKKAPKDPAALDALIFIVQMGPTAKEATEATEIIIKDHVKSPRMARLCRVLVFGTAVRLHRRNWSRQFWKTTQVSTRRGLPATFLLYDRKHRPSSPRD